MERVRAARAFALVLLDTMVIVANRTRAARTRVAMVFVAVLCLLLQIPVPLLQAGVLDDSAEAGLTHVTNCILGGTSKPNQHYLINKAWTFMEITDSKL